MLRKSTVDMLAAVSVVLTLWGCTPVYWSTYRYDALRGGNQPAVTALSDPKQVPKLAVKATFPAGGSEGAGFLASPIVVGNRVYIGSLSGRFYALDATTLQPIWQYPPAGQQPLLGSCVGNPGNPNPTQSWGRYGIQSSATYYKNAAGVSMVIFGASDPSADSGQGSASLFALNPDNGNLIWKSDVVAHLDGCTNPPLLTERHERIAYSSPLVLDGVVYVGVHNSGDDPTQRGSVAAVSADTGHLIPGFTYFSVPAGAHGGGVWNSLAADPEGDVYFTTGNVRCNGVNCIPSDPAMDYSLSMVRIDPKTGGVSWHFQAVPFDLDDDPDWAAGVAIVQSSCGTMATSVQKDGWTYAVDTATGNCRWQFPPSAPSGCKFPSGGPHDHTDTDYKRPGAIWGDVLAITTGGESLVQDGVAAGYGRLHALNVCAADELHRVRWLLDVPNATLGGPSADTGGIGGYALGAPTVTGGIFYVTTDQGHLVALADPSVAPASGYRCSNVDFTITQCTQAGFAVVPIPVVLANVALPDASATTAASAPAAMRNEPVLANGKVYVATPGGHVYMLSP